MATKIRIPNQKRSKEKKKQIIEASIRLFSENGYYNTSSNQISKTAGVSIGSFYSYFSDKKQLMLEAINYYDEQIREGMKTDLSGSPAVLKANGVNKEIVVHQFIRNTIQAHKINPDFHREIAAVSILEPDIQRIIHEQEKRVIGNITALLDMWASELRVTDLQTASTLLFLTVEKVSHSIVFPDIPVDEEKLIKELAEMILRYLFK